MDDIISNMGETVFAVGLVFFVLLFGFLTAAVRSSRAREQLKKHPIKKCPFCAEMVLLEAKVCKHCGRDFAQPSATVQPPGERFFYHADGAQQGPVDGGELMLLWQEGIITNDTPVILDGESQWRCIRDYMSLLSR